MFIKGVKTMKAKKEASGKWRCRAYLGTDADGKKHMKSFTADTKKEAEYLAMQYLQEYKHKKKVEKRRSADEITLREAYDKYIAAREASLSPSTIEGYLKLQRNGYLELMDMRVCDITQDDIQRATDIMNIIRGPKTIHNYHGLLAAVIHSVRPDMPIRTNLKRIENPDYHIPEEDDIHIMINAVKHRPNLLNGILLAAFGSLRRSEICEVDASDIDFEKGIVYVKRAMIHDRHKKWVTSVTKGKDSKREVTMPIEVLDLLPKEGRICNYKPGSLTNQFILLGKKLFGKQRYRLHDLRHYQASILHALGIPDQYIMARGGWKTDHTLKSVYRHTMTKERQKFEDKICDYFSSTFGDDLKKVDEKVDGEK